MTTTDTKQDSLAGRVMNYAADHPGLNVTVKELADRMHLTDDERKRLSGQLSTLHNAKKVQRVINGTYCLAPVKKKKHKKAKEEEETPPEAPTRPAVLLITGQSEDGAFFIGRDPDSGHIYECLRKT